MGRGTRTTERERGKNDWKKEIGQKERKIGGKKERGAGKERNEETDKDERKEGRGSPVEWELVVSVMLAGK